MIRSKTLDVLTGFILNCIQLLHKSSIVINHHKWVCLKMGYTPNYSHLVGIMISKTIGFGGTQHFQTHPNVGSDSTTNIPWNLALSFGFGLSPWPPFLSLNVAQQGRVPWQLVSNFAKVKRFLIRFDTFCLEFCGVFIYIYIS